MELKVVEQMSKRNGTLVLRVSGHWVSAQGLSWEVVPRRTCVSPVPSLGFDIQ